MQARTEMTPALRTLLKETVKVKSSFWSFLIPETNAVHKTQMMEMMGTRYFCDEASLKGKGGSFAVTGAEGSEFSVDEDKHTQLIQDCVANHKSYLSVTKRLDLIKFGAVAFGIAALCLVPAGWIAIGLALTGFAVFSAAAALRGHVFNQYTDSQKDLVSCVAWVAEKDFSDDEVRSRVVQNLFKEIAPWITNEQMKSIIADGANEDLAMSMLERTRLEQANVGDEVTHAQREVYKEKGSALKSLYGVGQDSMFGFIRPLAEGFFRGVRTDAKLAIEWCKGNSDDKTNISDHRWSRPSA